MSCVKGARCKLGCLHAAFVQAYREERERQETIANDMYASERREWLESHPLPTFKQWLLWHASHCAKAA